MSVARAAWRTQSNATSSGEEGERSAAGKLGSTVRTGGKECSGSQCECPGGTLDCGSGCVDITANPQHCGSCAEVCDGTEDRVSYQCQCKPGLFRCSGVCVDRQTDENNCGICGLTCSRNKTCQDGACSN